MVNTLFLVMLTSVSSYINWSVSDLFLYELQRLRSIWTGEAEFSDGSCFGRAWLFTFIWIVYRCEFDSCGSIACSERKSYRLCFKNLHSGWTQLCYYGVRVSSDGLALQKFPSYFTEQRTQFIMDNSALQLLKTGKSYVIKGCDVSLSWRNSMLVLYIGPNKLML